MDFISTDPQDYNMLQHRENGQKETCKGKHKINKLFNLNIIHEKDHW